MQSLKALEKTHAKAEAPPPLLGGINFIALGGRPRKGFPSTFAFQPSLSPRFEQYLGQSMIALLCLSVNFVVSSRKVFVMQRESSE